MLQADGSGMYTLQALWTQAREGLDITTVVFSNRGYESLKGELFKVGANPGRTALDMLEIKEPQLDWTSLARGIRVEGERVENVAALLRALQHGFRSEGPYLIEAIVDCNAGGVWPNLSAMNGSSRSTNRKWISTKKAGTTTNCTKLPSNNAQPSYWVAGEGERAGGHERRGLVERQHGRAGALVNASALRSRGGR